MNPLVLASASAIRLRMLTNAGIAVEPDPADIDETVIKDESRRTGRSADDCAMRLAEAKARAVAVRHPGRLVLGADQMLECDGRWFDKPVERRDAREQLRALRGRRHRLVTAAAIVRDGEECWRAIECPTLAMRPFSDSFLDRYLERMGDRVLKTVGCYELEGIGAQLMAQIDGDYFAVLGLPLLSILHFLRETGALPP